jgi:hypothetical protein
MKPSKPLDQWQIQLIKYFKSNKDQQLDVCLAIWRERCCLPKDYDTQGCLEYMVGDLVDVFMSMIGENDREGSLRGLIFDAHQDQQWKFHCGADRNQKYPSDGYRYWVNWLWVIASRLRLTEVKYLTDFPSSLSPKSK